MSVSRTPSLIDRAKLALRVFRGGLPRSRRPYGKAKLPFIWPSWRDGQPQWQIVDLATYVEEGFDANTLIYSALMYKFRAVTIAPLRAYEGDIDHPEILKPSHPLSKLVSRPNARMSGKFFAGLVDVYLNLAGYAPVLLQRPRAGGLPEAMYPLRPDRVFIIPDGRDIRGYLYVPEGKSMTDGLPVLPADMMFPKLPNPGDPLEGLGYGLSPVSPMAHSADVDNMVTKFIKLFFERGAMITGLLKFDAPLDDTVVDQVKERWRETYGGYENWDVGVLDQGGDYTKIGMTFEEMGFETLDERNESRILGPFGVPPILIGSRLGLLRSTYANYAEARKAFWEDTMTPEQGLLEDEYDYFLQSDDGGFIRHDTSKVPALRKDVTTLTTAWAALVDRGVPKARAAEVVGLEIGELPDGDVVYLNLSMIPLGSKRPAPEGGAPESGAGGDGGGQQGDGAGGGQGGAGAENDNQGAAEAEGDQRAEGKDRKAWTPEQKADHWKAVDAVATSWEAPFTEGARTCFETDLREVLALAGGAKAKAKKARATIDWSAFEGDVAEYLSKSENWQGTFVPLIQGVVEEQGQRWATELGLAFDVQNLFARDWFNSYVMTFARDINQTTKDVLAQVAAQAIRDGWSIETMQGHIESVFRQMAYGDAPPDDLAWYEERMVPYRSELIARDQTLRASNAGNHELFSEWEVGRREWLTTLDGRERETHHLANGQVRGLDEPFEVGGYRMMFPGDDSLGADISEIIQCRCTELPIVQESEE